MTDTNDVTRLPLKILIADDDPAVVRALTRRCADLGFEVETATNGINALIIARRHQPDVLIVDVNMPELDGLSVCTHLLNPGMKSMDVIVVTGADDPEIELRCKSMGTFYGNKKTNFWNSISNALAKIAPEMAGRINDLEVRSSEAKVPTRPRVLIIDDDPDIKLFLSSRLAKFGVETLYASDAAQGYKMALREQPSVIISDFFMPNGDALYLLRKLRGNLETENIPFIVVSGRNLDKPTERDLMQGSRGRSGAAKVFSKSRNSEELFDFLRRYCGFYTKHLSE
jgi:CheY-like chemotaxis protein